MLLLLTYKLSYVALFHGRKVSNDNGLSMVSAVRTFTLVRKVPYPILVALHFLPRGSPGNKEVLISVFCRALTSLPARSEVWRLLWKVGLPVMVERGSLSENGYIESFNGKLRDELLSRDIFTSLTEAMVLIDEWRKEYN